MAKDADFAEIVGGRAKGGDDGLQTKDMRKCLGYVCKAAGSVNENNHSINFVISTDGVDHDGEVVEQAAVAAAITRFGKNPIALAGHSHKLPDGKPPVIGSWDVGSYRQFKHRSEMRLHFAVDTELGMEYWILYSQKHMRAVSLGFALIDGYRDVRAGKKVYVITKLMLIEISCVAAGACEGALSKSRQGKSDFVEGKRQEKEDDRILAELRAEDPDFDEKAEDFARVLLGCDDGDVMDEHSGGVVSQAIKGYEHSENDNDGGGDDLGVTGVDLAAVVCSKAVIPDAMANGGDTDVAALACGQR